MDQQDVVRTFEAERQKSRQRMALIGYCLGGLIVIVVGLNLYSQATRTLTDAEFQTKAEAAIAKSDLGAYTDLLQNQLDRKERDLSHCDEVILKGIKQFGNSRLSFVFGKLIKDEKDPSRADDLAHLLVRAESANVLASDPSTVAAGNAKETFADLADDLKLLAKPSADEAAEAEWCNVMAGRSDGESGPLPAGASADGRAFHASAAPKGGDSASLDGVSSSELRQPLAAIAAALTESNGEHNDLAGVFALEAKLLDSVNALPAGLADVLQKKADDLTKTIQSEAEAASSHIRSEFEDPSLTEVQFWHLLADHMAVGYQTYYDGTAGKTPQSLEDIAKSDYAATIEAKATVTQDTVTPLFLNAADRSKDQIDQSFAVTMQAPGAITFEAFLFKVHWVRKGTDFVIDKVDSVLTQADPASLNPSAKTKPGFTSSSSPAESSH